MTFTICLYLLELENNRYYVGRTDHIYKRYSDHVAGSGAVWTMQNKPLGILITKEMVVESNRQAVMYENWMTLHYMAKFGWENVRGGDYHLADSLKLKILLEPIYDCENNTIRYYVNNCLYLFGPSDTMLIYVLALENSRYYIGHTKRLGKALAKHFLSISTRWTSIHKPLRVCELIPVPDNEQYRVMKQRLLATYIERHGRERVIGGQEG